MFLWHESEDIYKKRLFQNFQLILILCLQVYMMWLALLHKLLIILVNETYVKIAFISNWNDFCLIPVGKCASWKRASNAKNSNFIIIIFFWEHPLYENWEYTFNVHTLNIYMQKGRLLF